MSTPARSKSMRGSHEGSLTTATSRAAGGAVGAVKAKHRRATILFDMKVTRTISRTSWTDGRSCALSKDRVGASGYAHAGVMIILVHKSPTRDPTRRSPLRPLSGVKRTLEHLPAMSPFDRWC